MWRLFSLPLLECWVRFRTNNEQVVFNSLKRWAINHSKYRIKHINGLCLHLPWNWKSMPIKMLCSCAWGRPHILSMNLKATVLESLYSPFVPQRSKSRGEWNIFHLSQWLICQNLGRWQADKHNEKSLVLESISQLCMHLFWWSFVCHRNIWLNWFSISFVLLIFELLTLL